MSNLRDLYQEVILDHYKKPRNFRRIEGGREAEGHNPLCGDEVIVSVRIEDDVVADVAFLGEGCAISRSAASVMTEVVKGLSTEEALARFSQFQQLITGKLQDTSLETLGKVAVFSTVCDFPVRIKCAALPWHTLKQALTGGAEPVTTE